jgi:3-hydroxybutyryl-CoA dehydratase
VTGDGSKEDAFSVAPDGGGDTAIKFKSASRAISERDIEQFAALTGDRHPAHMDQEWAEENLFGERVGHGLMVLSFAIGLLPTEAFLALRRIRNLVFKSPVRIGDTIRAELTLTTVRPVNDQISLGTGRLTVIKQDGAAALKMEAEVLIRRRAD